jgi:hypothetical protein
VLLAPLCGADARSGREDRIREAFADVSEEFDSRPLTSGARTQAREAREDFVEVARDADLVVLEVAEPGAVPTDGFHQGSRDLSEAHVDLRVHVRRAVLVFTGE